MIRVKFWRSEGFVERLVIRAPGAADATLELGPFPDGLQLTYGDLRDCTDGRVIARCQGDQWTAVGFARLPFSDVAIFEADE